MKWSGQQIVILGAARQGKAMAAYFAKQGANVRLSDVREAKVFADDQKEMKDLNIQWIFGAQKASLLKKADYLSLSGGVSPQLPIVTEAKKQGIPIINDSQVFLEDCPCLVVGITGSAGKTTTTLLLGRILDAMKNKRYPRVWIGGNIGNPLISRVEEMQSSDIAVMELSSFQLELMDRSPQIAAVLNLAPNHLDRHATMADYVAAKARILEFQDQEGVAILNRDDHGSWSLKSRVKGNLWTFGRDKLAENLLGTFLTGKDIWIRNQDGENRLLAISFIALRGEHNLMNVLAACCISAALGASKEDMQKGLENFSGAPHRLELIRTIKRVEWFNDSIATSPQRAEASISSFDQPIVLLVGGRDKQLNWENFAKLSAKKAKSVLAFGEAGPMIEHVFGKYLGRKVKLERFEKMEESIEAARQIAAPGDIVLLAPGGTSFDEFDDFADRGDTFRELVNKL